MVPNKNFHPISIGLDFDNTIVCYDSLFHRVALEKNLIPQELPISKESVRDFLRKENAEEAWTLLQSTVYGTRMKDAFPFPGFLDFLTWVTSSGFQIKIISHKTKIPYLGPPYDLHKEALQWMKQYHFFSPKGFNISLENVFFESTKEKKLQRIGSSGCHLFIDDLPELLTAPSFPRDVQPILFSPTLRKAPHPSCLVAETWKEVILLVQNYISSDALP